MSAQSVKFPIQGTFLEQNSYVNSLPESYHPVLSPAIKAIESNPMSLHLKDELPRNIKATICKHSQKSCQNESGNANEITLPSYSKITRIINGKNSKKDITEVRTTFCSNGEESTIRIVMTQNGEIKVVRLKSPFEEIKKGLNANEDGFIIQASCGEKSLYTVKRVINFKG